MRPPTWYSSRPGRAGPRLNSSCAAPSSSIAARAWSTAASCTCEHTKSLTRSARRDVCLGQLVCGARQLHGRSLVFHSRLLPLQTPKILTKLDFRLDVAQTSCAQKLDCRLHKVLSRLLPLHTWCISCVSAARARVSHPHEHTMCNSKAARSTVERIHKNSNFTHTACLSGRGTSPSRTAPGQS